MKKDNLPLLELVLKAYRVLKKYALLLYELALKSYRVLKTEGIVRFFTISKNYLFGGKPIADVAADFTPSPDDLEKVRLDRLREECRAFEYRPKISIILPVWNIEPRRLELSIDSVLKQVYDNWELCVAGDKAAESDVRRMSESPFNFWIAILVFPVHPTRQ